MASLSELAPEILCLILQNLDSPLELYAVIRASVACYRAFCASRNGVLSHVLRNAIGPAMPDALATLYSSYVIEPGPVLGSHHKVEMDAFLDTLPEGDLEFPQQQDRIERLSRLCVTVQSFVADYSNRGNALLVEQNPQPLELSASPENLELRQGIPLSAIESARFQRAFFRFQTFCNCFRPRPEYGYPLSHFSPPAQNRSFLSTLREWEIEELCCIHQYLTSKVAHVVKGLEDDFYADVMQIRDSDNTRLSPSQNKDEDPNLYVVENLDLKGLYLFSKTDKTRHEFFLSGFCSSGIEFIKGLLNSSTSSRRSQIKQNTHALRCFLREALMSFDFRNHQKPTLPVLAAKESLSSYNLGWFQTSGELSKSWLSLSSRHTLRDWGYVFWDVSRLENVSLENVAYKYDDKETVEERLRGVRVERRRFERTIQKFFAGSELPGST